MTTEPVASPVPEALLAQDRPSASQNALDYYRGFRSRHLLPEGWSEEYEHGPEPTPPAAPLRVHLESPDYHLELRFGFTGEHTPPGWIDLVLSRKDRRLPSEPEAKRVAELLLRVPSRPNDYLEVCQYTPNGRPVGFVRSLEMDPDPHKHHAMEVLVAYPPAEARDG